MKTYCFSDSLLFIEADGEAHLLKLIEAPWGRLVIDLGPTCLLKIFGILQVSWIFQVLKMKEA